MTNIKRCMSNEFKLACALFKRALSYTNKGGCYAQLVTFDVANEHYEKAKRMYRECIENGTDTYESNGFYVHAERLKNEVLDVCFGIA